MANFIISPYAISWDSIKNQLNDFIQSKSEEQTWKDFYVSGAGETVVEIAAALGAFYAYHFITGRRESYLSTAQNYSSLVGLAQNAGYSAGRGTNLKVRLTFTNTSENAITINKWDVIGTYSVYDVVALIDTEDNSQRIVCTPNSSVEIDCVIGNLVIGTDAITIPSSDLTSFSFHSANATSDLRLILNNTELPTSNQFKDLTNDKWVIITNTYGCIDAFYLNTNEGKYNYRVNDILYVQFIERNNLTWNMFNASNLNLVNGICNNAELISDLVTPEDIGQIRLKAPLYHETNMVIRSRKDYSKYLLLANNSLIDANDKDITPGLIELTYLKKDGTLMTDEEIEHWLNAIEESRPSGVARAAITHPIEVPLTLDIQLWYTGEEISPNLSELIDELLESYNNKLGVNLDLIQIEHEIERFNGIKIARVNIVSSRWQPNTGYQLYDVVTGYDGNSYYVESLQFKTGDTKPTWPENVGETVTDGDIIWEKVSDFADTEWKNWQPNTNYKLFTYIREESVTDSTYGNTGTIQPVFTNASSVLYDDYHVVWKHIGTTLPEGYEAKGIWKPNTIYYKEIVDPDTQTISRKGDVIYVRVDGIINYFKCVECYAYTKVDIYRVKSYFGKSSSNELSWDSDIVKDNVLCWRKVLEIEYNILPEGLIEWEPNHDYAIGDTISIITESGDTFKVKKYTVTSLLGISSQDEPTWNSQSGIATKDNNIIWKKIATEKNYKLDWNQYFQIKKYSPN